MSTMATAEAFIRFIREYAPIPRQANMYHEEIEERAASLGVDPIKFDHPALARIKQHFAPDEARLNNLILTGTAGDGKTRMLYDYWRELHGPEEVLANRPKHASLTASVEGVSRQFHFIFDLSKCLPDKGQIWNPGELALLEAWVDALLAKSPVVFVVAANDGKLLQALRSLKAARENSTAVLVEAEIEDMLASRRAKSEKLSLALLDLSEIGSAETFDRACTAFLKRAEWNCFQTDAADPAFGPLSPLRRNWEILRQPQFQHRLHTLIELCDVNGSHISVRDLMAMIVNGLLGHPKAADRVLTLDEIRQLAAPGENLRGSIHRNIFGENLKEEKRQDFLVFSYFNYFRVGLETANGIDELLLFGRELPQLEIIHERLVADPTGFDAINPAFEALRRDYLEAESFDDARRDEFLSELAQQRRRLFFRIPENDPAFDPWQLTIFQYAGRFLATILHPLKRGELPGAATIETLVRGLNRVWSGMLFDEGNKLYLTSGLDFTSARISRLALHAVPVVESLSGEHIEIALNSRGQPELMVYLLSGPPIAYRLDLMRFEFLVRVADGALPNSFSRECYEDVINFKSILLAKVQSMMAKREVKNFKYLSSDAAGRPSEETINL